MAINVKDKTSQSDGREATQVNGTRISAAEPPRKHRTCLDLHLILKTEDAPSNVLLNKKQWATFPKAHNFIPHKDWDNYPTLRSNNSHPVCQTNKSKFAWQDLASLASIQIWSDDGIWFWGFHIYHVIKKYKQWIMC